MTAKRPSKIGKYDVVDLIGKGSAGILYKATDPFLDRTVAIKVLTAGVWDYPDLQRFYREARAVADLRHPNIATIINVGDHDEAPYIVTEWIDRGSLESMLRGYPQIDLLEKIRIVIEVCRALGYAHERGIVHRDIKPANIMVSKDGGVKIIDFAIARIDDTNFTRAGQLMGSLNYMSIEQLNDKVQVDQRTDVYSTGVVLYQMLTGVLPFDAENAGTIPIKILNGVPPPFSKYISSYPTEIEQITMRALAKDRDQRYSSAGEMASDLAQLQDRLKHERIAVHLQKAEHLLQQNELFQANEELQEILKLDMQHTVASSMARDLRKRIEKEQSVERARQLCDQAEEALRREEYDSALTFVEQAIHLGPTNPNLTSIRARVQAAKAEIEHLRQVMQRAENAHRAGALDTAKQAIEEVLVRRPDDTRVRSLYRIIQKELEDRLQQKRLETARQEMSGRSYTAAFEVMKEVEKVDPESPATLLGANLPVPPPQATSFSLDKSKELPAATVLGQIRPPDVGGPWDRGPEGRVSVQPFDPLRVSIAHPRMFSKGHGSRVLVTLYLAGQAEEVRKALDSDFSNGSVAKREPYVEKRDATDIELRTRVQVELFSQAIDFSQAVTLDLSKSINCARFLAKPREDCLTGEHQAKVIIKDCVTGAERYSGFFQAKIVDYMFDHVSRPFFSKCTSAVLTAGSLVTFLLTILGRFDHTLGLSTGTAALLLGSAVFGNVFKKYVSPDRSLPRRAS